MMGAEGGLVVGRDWEFSFTNDSFVTVALLTKSFCFFPFVYHDIFCIYESIPWHLISSMVKANSPTHSSSIIASPDCPPATVMPKTYHSLNLICWFLFFGTLFSLPEMHSQTCPTDWILSSFKMPCSFAEDKMSKLTFLGRTELFHSYLFHIALL